MLIEEMNLTTNVIHLETVDKAISFIKEHCITEDCSLECPDIILPPGGPVAINMPIKDGRFARTGGPAAI